MGAFEFSPDGTRIAFSWNCTGQWEIYEVLLDESPPSSQKELSFRQVTKGPGAKFSPHYSPGGRLPGICARPGWQRVV